LVRTQGRLPAVVAHAADAQDRQGGRLVAAAASERFLRLQRMWADQGSAGELGRTVDERERITLEVVYPPDRQLTRYAADVLPVAGHGAGFWVLPKRWFVERTCSWISRQRRLSKDYERLTSPFEAWIYPVSIRLLLARLT
jgi:putative transposase